MRIIDDDLLDRFRSAGRCEICRKQCKQREPHHHRRKGFGSGARLDVAINLVALGSSALFCCGCHGSIHAGEIPNEAVLAAIAKREKERPQDIEEALFILERLPKNASLETIKAETDAISAAVRNLVWKAIEASQDNHKRGG